MTGSCAASAFACIPPHHTTVDASMRSLVVPSVSVTLWPSSDSSDTPGCISTSSAFSAFSMTGCASPIDCAILAERSASTTRTLPLAAIAFRDDLAQTRGQLGRELDARQPRAHDDRRVARGRIGQRGQREQMRLQLARARVGIDIE